jgi:hypothetical protein
MLVVQQIVTEKKTKEEVERNSSEVEENNLARNLENTRITAEARNGKRKYQALVVTHVPPDHQLSKKSFRGGK